MYVLTGYCVLPKPLYIWYMYPSVTNWTLNTGTVKSWLYRPTCLLIKNILSSPSHKSPPSLSTLHIIVMQQNLICLKKLESNDKYYNHMIGFMESFFWRQNLAVKPSTCFAQKQTFNIDINPLDFLIVY
jgi:hypothetical protein